MSYPFYPTRPQAERIAGSVLLHHVSPGGGSSSHEIDAQRAEEVAQTLTGPELLQLLADAARKGGEYYESQFSFKRSRIIEEVRRLAVRTDSLALHQFIEREDARDDRKDHHE